MLTYLKLTLAAVLLSGCMATGPVSVIPNTGGPQVSSEAVEAQREQTKSDIDVITDALLGVTVALDVLG